MKRRMTGWIALLMTLICVSALAEGSDNWLAGVLGGARSGEKQEGQPSSKKRKRRRNDRPRPLERSLYARQKDSTEQESLMRPYYISHDD